MPATAAGRSSSSAGGDRSWRSRRWLCQRWHGDGTGHGGAHEAPLADGVLDGVTERATNLNSEDRRFCVATNELRVCRRIRWSSANNDELVALLERRNDWTESASLEVGDFRRQFKTRGDDGESFVVRDWLRHRRKRVASDQHLAEPFSCRDAEHGRDVR